MHCNNSFFPYQLCKEKLSGRKSEKILSANRKDRLVWWEFLVACRFSRQFFYHTLTSCFCLSTPSYVYPFNVGLSQGVFPMSFSSSFSGLCLGISFMVLIMTSVWKPPRLASLSPTISFYLQTWISGTFSNWVSHGHLKFNTSKAELISLCSVMHTSTAEFSVLVNDSIILPAAAVPPYLSIDLVGIC